MRREINNLDYVVINNIKSNQVNYVIENEVKVDSTNSLANNPVKYTLHILTITLRGGKKSI